MDYTRQLPPLSILNEAFELDTERGVLLRKRTYKQHKAGQVCGSPMPDGYIIVGVQNKKLLAHRIIYYIATGVDPVGYVVDHRNGDRSDNRLCNLRLATKLENTRHKVGVSAANASGYRNVSWDNHWQRWKVSLSVGGKRIQRKFKTLEEAAQCAAELRRLHYGEFEGVPA